MSKAVRFQGRLQKLRILVTATVPRLDFPAINRTGLVTAGSVEIDVVVEAPAPATTSTRQYLYGNKLGTRTVE